MKLLLALLLLATPAFAQDAMEVVMGKVLQKLQHGILVDCDAVGGLTLGAHKAENGTFQFSRDGMIPKRAERTVFLLDHPRFAQLVDGDEVCVIAHRTGTYSAGGSTFAAYRTQPK